MTAPAAFPWGSNHPTRRQRVLVATGIALLVCVRFYATHSPDHGIYSDFSPIRFAADAMLHGADPYRLIGPGLVFESRLPVLYPATAYVLAIPFLALAEPWASMTFIAISSFLLAYSVTKDSWHRLPLFASVAFISSAQLAQWSILMTAALFIPALAFVAAAKPQTGLPVLAASTSPVALRAAFAGAIVLTLVSLTLLPGWPAEWLQHARDTEQLRAPVMRLGGAAILLVLLRWRRPEAWLVLTMAVLPQTWYSYNLLPLLTVGNSFRESGVLALTSSAGAIGTAYLTTELYAPETARVGGAMLVATAYLPAVLMILRRPNEGPLPAWLGRLVTRR